MKQLEALRPKAVTWTRPKVPRVRLLRDLREARRKHGGSTWRRVVEMIALALGPGKVSPHEYFFFGLHKGGLSREERYSFIGDAAQDRILRICTDRRWWTLAEDKVIFYALMGAHGFPVPENLVVFATQSRRMLVPQLSTVESLTAFLRNSSIYPIFGKPVDGIYGAGAVSLTSYAPETDLIHVANGAVIGASDLAGQVARESSNGYLFQQTLATHPSLLEVCGDRLTTLRLAIKVTDVGPQIIRAVWKIPGEGSFVDNVAALKNLTAEVDYNTGQVVRVVRGSGLSAVEFEEHPETGSRLVGLVLPDWAEMKRACTAAATLLPGITLQGWDLAIARDGPVFLEVNVGGGFVACQIATGRGSLDSHVRSMLEANDPAWFRTVTLSVCRRFATEGLNWVLARLRSVARRRNDP